MLDIDSALIEKLAAIYGSPLFVFCEDEIRGNARGFREAFEAQYPKLQVAYSYKTNPLPGILRIIHDEGLWADACSGFEYGIARRLGVPGESIVFNGPYKTCGELSRAISEGALINIDHADELGLLEGLAAESGRAIEVGIRINLDAGIHQASDRFGFNLESGEAMAIAERCASVKLLRICALHFHLTSYVIEPDTGGEHSNLPPAAGVRLIYPKSAQMYRTASEKICRLASEIERKFDMRVKYLDMGGGFPSVDSLAPYVDAVVNPITSNFKGEMPTLILEPGRAIVRDAAVLISTVVAVKGGAVVIDAGVNLLPTSFWKWQEIETAGDMAAGDLQQTTVYGPLCLQTDIVSRARLPRLRAGSRLLVRNVGAYNIAQGSSFIFPRPGVIMLGGARGVSVLRYAETMDEALRSDRR
ncbi:MAG: diaminopimelate decarboxylase [Deltaproteobacteria bacterium]